MTYWPPAPHRIYAGFLVLALTLAGAPAKAASFTLSGVVKNEAGQGLANVDIDLIEYCNGTNVFLTNDKTLANGAFSVTVNEGTYDVHFTPAAGSTLAGSELESLSFHAPQNLGITVMHPGIKVAGTVKNGAGTGLLDVNLDFLDLATGHKIFLPNDLTDATGKYSVRVLPGTYDIEYRPAATTTLLTGWRRGVAVGADITGLVDTLGTGLRVTARALNALNAPVKDVDVDLYDTCAGQTIPTAHDNSDAAGNITVYVPNGDYTITFGPPRCTSMGAERIAGQRVSNNKSLGDITLPDAFPVDGRVIRPPAQIVPGTDLNFYDAATGSRQASVRDNTNTSGNFIVNVPAGIFNLDFSPPVGSGLLATRVGPLTVTGATGMGDIMLTAGMTLSGMVRGPGNAPIPNADIDVVDPLTGASLRLAHDTTAADGAFSVVVPPGTWDVRYTPPGCLTLAQTDQQDVVVSAPLALAPVTLVQGVHATGLVLGPGALAVGGADLDFFPPGSRQKIFTVADNTNNSGTYDVFVPPAVYDIDYLPPAGTTLRPAQRFGVSILANTALPNVVLTTGLAVSGTVRSDATGSPVASVDVSFYTPGSGVHLLTPHNIGAADGTYSVIVDAGTWDILFTPPAASGLAPLWRRAVIVSASTALSDTRLLPLVLPTVAIVSPASGSTAGGQTLTVTGTGFQLDVTIKVGGISAKNLVLVSSTTMTAKTPPHAAGLFDVTVTNPGAQSATKAGAYRFNEPATPIKLTVSKSAGNTVLSWLTTGQAGYTIYGQGLPTAWTDAAFLTTTTLLTWTQTGVTPTPGITFFQVD